MTRREERIHLVGVLGVLMGEWIDGHHYSSTVDLVVHDMWGKELEHSTSESDRGAKGSCRYILGLSRVRNQWLGWAVYAGFVDERPFRSCLLSCSQPKVRDG